MPYVSWLEPSVEKCIMHRFAVWFDHNPQIFTRLCNERPMTDTPIFLRFRAYGITQHVLNPFLFEIGTPR